MEGPADSFFEDNEPDIHFNNFEIIHKEKRTILIGKKEKQAYIDYIAKKKMRNIYDNRNSFHKS